MYCPPGKLSLTVEAAKTGTGVDLLFAEYNAASTSVLKSILSIELVTTYAIKVM